MRPGARHRGRDRRVAPARFRDLHRNARLLGPFSGVQRRRRLSRSSPAQPMQRAVPSVPRERKPVTPRLSRTAISALIAALTLALAPGAFAASEQGDAGDLRATSQDLGDAAVTSITGTFTNASDADVYRLCLTNGSSFSASTVGMAPGMDTQLFLLDADGLGVYANDDAPGQPATAARACPRATASPRPRGASTSSRSASTTATRTRTRVRSSRTASTASSTRTACFPRTGSARRSRSRAGWGARSPANAATVPQGASVVVDFSCADEGGSGLASCVGTTADGAQLDTSDLGPVSVTVTARDGAGNQTTRTHTVTVVDETAPEVTIDSPVNGAVYGRDDVVLADYACADEANGSGLASCTGDVANGSAVDTSTLGEHTFTADAADNAGNESSDSVTYTVVDETAPTISLVTPADGAVYGLGEGVAADYSCADEAHGSGLATCSGTVADA